MSLYGKLHITYTIISFVLTALIFILGKRFLKSERAHNMLVRAFAVITVFLHLSPLWIDYLKNGTATVSPVMLFPIYPCNVCMWLLVIAATVKRRGVLYKLLGEFLCIVGTVCGVIGLVFNANFAANPTLADWEIFKGLLSHSTMIVGTLYLGISGLVKIRFRSVISVIAGLLLFAADGALINWIFAAANLPAQNSMYLQSPPFESMPWLTTAIIGVVGIAVAVIFTALYERTVLGKKFKEIFTLKNLFDFKETDA